jgi:hypothetical protein
MYNGINVLDQVTGLLECVDGYRRDDWYFYSVLEQDKGFLGKLMHHKRHDGPHGYGTMFIMRPTLIRRIIKFAQEEGGGGSPAVLAYAGRQGCHTEVFKWQ